MSDRDDLVNVLRRNAVIARSRRGEREHFEDCWKFHSDCALERAADALAAAPVEPPVLSRAALEEMAHALMSNPERWERMGWMPYEPRVAHVEDKIWLALRMFADAILESLSQDVAAPPVGPQE